MITFIVGLVIAAAGGVILYRAFFVHTGADFVVTTSGEIHEVRNWWKLAGGLALLLIGAATAFLAARRSRA